MSATGTRRGLLTLTGVQEELLSQWRAIALQRMGFFADLLFAMKPINAPGLGTFAVDKGWRLYIDFDAVTEFGDLWCGEALLHEAGHLWYQHAQRAIDCGLAKSDGRMTQRNGRISNLSGDAAINDDLVEAGCTTIGDDGVLPEDFGLPRHETYEFYVKELLRATQPPPSGGSDKGQGMPGGPGGNSGNPSLPSDDADEFGLPTTGKGCGSGAGNLPREQEIPNHDSLGGKAEAATDADKDRVMNGTAAAILDASQAGRGSVPGGLFEQATLYLTPPQVKWQKLVATLFRFATSVRPGDADQTWNRRNRRRNNIRYGGGKVLSPGTFTPSPTAVVVRDNSGSVGRKMFMTFTSEIVGIANQCGIRDDDLIIIDVDAEVNGVTKFRKPTDLAVRHGGGGTDLTVGYEAGLCRSPAPNIIIFLTDGFTPWPDSRPRGVTVVACIATKETSPSRAQFGVPAWIRVVFITSDGK